MRTLDGRNSKLNPGSARSVLRVYSFYSIGLNIVMTHSRNGGKKKIFVMQGKTMDFRDKETYVVVSLPFLLCGF